MELNKLVFPTPPSSYSHETLNNGLLTLATSIVTKGMQHGLRNNKGGKPCMLYIPKFDMFEST